jgi:hypothetical protein
MAQPMPAHPEKGRDDVEMYGIVWEEPERKYMYHPLGPVEVVSTERVEALVLWVKT